MILSTTETIPGKKITKVLGLVKGNTIRARHFGADIAAGLKTLVGGEIKSYTKMIEAARKQAIDRMVEDAKKEAAFKMEAAKKGFSEDMLELAVSITIEKIRNNISAKDDENLITSFSSGLKTEKSHFA